MSGQNAGKLCRIAAGVVIALLAWCAPAAAQEPVHITSRIIYLEVDPTPDGEFQFFDETVFSQEPMLFGDGMLAGLGGDTAQGQWRADMRTGKLGASVEASNALYPGTWSRSTGSLSVGLRDTLRIITPAGDYPDGFDIALPYTITGSLQADLQNPLGPVVSGLYMSAAIRLKLGLSTHEETVDLISAPNVLAIDNEGELKVTLNLPYSAVPQVTEVDVSASIQVDAEMSGINPDPVLLSGLTLGVDLNQTVTLGPLQVPENCSWTSESGQFLAGLPVPEPGGLGLVGVVLVALRRRRR